MASLPSAGAIPARASDQAYIHPNAAWRVTLDGRDLTATLAPRLVSLTLTEKGGMESDRLELVLTDHDGQIELPPEGARLTVALGWKRGTGVDIGLVEKGSFKVDDIGWEGPPDLITITASAADFAASFRTRKTRIWKDTTLGAVVGKIAGEHGLIARCHPDLAGKAVTLAEQAGKSDMAFLRDLGRRYDAIAAPKDGHLVFSPVGAATTATGKTIPTIALSRRDGDRARYHRAARERAEDGAEADWHDSAAARRKSEKQGGSKRRKLKRVYASQDDASAAAGAETARRKRAAAEMDLSLALGRAELSAGLRVSLTGYKPEIDLLKWRVAEATHTMDARGLVTQLKLDVAD